MIAYYLKYIIEQVLGEAVKNSLGQCDCYLDQ